MNIIQYPNEILTTKSEKITDISEVKEKLIAMKHFVASEDNTAVGLALPQVGVLKRGFVARIDNQVIVFINPIIIKKSKNKSDMTEGCMSIENISGIVSRHKSITVKYNDLKGKPHIMNLQGFNARVAQHEIDHLNGILFTDLAYQVKEAQGV